MKIYTEHSVQRSGHPRDRRKSFTDRSGLPATAAAPRPTPTPWRWRGPPCLDEGLPRHRSVPPPPPPPPPAPPPPFFFSGRIYPVRRGPWLDAGGRQGPWGSARIWRCPWGRAARQACPHPDEDHTSVGSRTISSLLLVVPTSVILLKVFYADTKSTKK